MREVELDLGQYAPYEPAPGVGRWRFDKSLPLTTSGHLRVVALGVGSAFAGANYQSNLIVIKGKTALFVDLGTLAVLRLRELGVTCNDIEHVLITHSHADHIGSLEELALRRRYETPFAAIPQDDGEPWPAYMVRVTDARCDGRFRPRLYVPDFYARQLWGMSLRGGLAFSEEVEIGGPEGGMKLEHFFDVLHPKPLDQSAEPSWQIDVGPIHVQTFVTQHVPDTASGWNDCMYSVGLVIDQRLFISGDTRFDLETVLRFGNTCESLWHDCQHFEGGVHAYYGQIKTLPDDLRQRMHLYHLTDQMAQVDVKADGFAGRLRSAPVVYDFE